MIYEYTKNQLIYGNSRLTFTPSWFIRAWDQVVIIYYFRWQKVFLFFVELDFCEPAPIFNASYVIKLKKIKQITLKMILIYTKLSWNWGFCKHLTEYLKSNITNEVQIKHQEVGIYTFKSLPVNLHSWTRKSFSSSLRIPQQWDSYFSADLSKFPLGNMFFSNFKPEKT